MQTKITRSAALSEIHSAPPRVIDGGRHDPSEPIRCLEDHIMSASRLSRAMWLALDGKEDHEFDERDRLALYELASVVAHHSSAALHLFHNTDGE